MSNIKTYDTSLNPHQKIQFAIDAVENYKVNRDEHLIELLGKNPKNILDLLNTMLIVMNSINKTAGKYVKDVVTSRVAEEINNTSSIKYNSLEELQEQVENILTQQYPEILRKGLDSEDQNKILIDTIKKILLEYKDLTEDEKDEIIDGIAGFGPISKYMQPGADHIEEIQINDFNDIKVIVGGRPVDVPERFNSPKDLDLFVSKLINRAGKQQKNVKPISEAEPYTRIRLGTSTRVSIMGAGIVGRPNALQNSLTEDQRKIPPINVCIRKQKDNPITTDQMLKWKSIDPYGLALLEALIGHGVSIMGFGITGSGKTAMIKAITEKCVPSDLRIITVAETDEMQLRSLDTEEYLTETKVITNSDGTQEKITEKVRDENGEYVKNPNYLKPKINALMWEIPSQEIKILDKEAFTGAVNASLTFTPEMIIFQETKGGEIKDLIEEAVSGHQVMTTIHVKSAELVPLRVLLMYQQSGTKISDDKILAQVPAAFPVLVEFKRYKDGSRKVASISEITDFDMITQKAILRPLTKYVVKRNYVNEDGKKVVEGEFYAICDPLDEREGKLKDIMLDNFITEEEISNLRVLYESAKNEDLLSNYNNFIKKVS